MGLGIHGEPGMAQQPWKPCAPLVDDMVKVIAARLPPAATVGGGGLRPCALLINNLGGTPAMEVNLH